MCAFQVKFSELSLDTFRMLQALEWEPSGSLYRTRVGEVSNKMSSSGHVGVVEEIPDPSLPPNPHKYVLYRPSVQHLLLVSGKQLLCPSPGDPCSILILTIRLNLSLNGLQVICTLFGVK